MNDLDAQLEQLAEMPTRAAPTADELQAWDRRRSLRRARIATATAAVVLMIALGGAALAQRGPEPAGVAVTLGTAVAPTTTSVATTSVATTIVASTVPGPPPDGATTVDPTYGYRIAGPGGRIAGYVAKDVMEEAMNTGPPPLSIGTGAVPVRGFEVHDRHGVLVGYYLESIGFLSLEAAADPWHVDRLVKENAPMSQADAKALLEELQAEAERHGG